VEDLSLPTSLVPPSTRQASVEIIEDDNDHYRHSTGAPKNLDTILESVDDNNNMYFTPLVARKDWAAKKRQSEVAEESMEEDLARKRLMRKNLAS
jgi:hypothetical protein